MELTETFSKLISGQFFVVYRANDFAGRVSYIHKLDGDRVARKDWLAAKAAAESAIAG